jgi:hypothetical protein
VAPPVPIDESCIAGPTHGSCAHSSADCRTPATGHIKTATINNWEKLEGTPPRHKRGNDEDEDQVAKRHKQRDKNAARKKEAKAQAALAAARALVAQADAQTTEE